MSNENRSERKDAGKPGIPLERYAAGLSAVTLSAPRRPPPSGPLPEPGARKYELFQELSALSQEIHDEFSSLQLALADIKGRIEADLPAGSERPRPPAEGPEPHEKAQAAPVPPPARRPADGPVPVPCPSGAGPGFLAVPFLAAAVLCAAAFALYMFYPARKAVSYFALPPGRTAGLCLDPYGTRVFFSDPQRQLLFTVSAANGRVESVRSFPAAAVTGLAFDGSAFWSSGGKAIYRYKMNYGDWTGDAYPVEDGNAYWLSWDGKNLWSAAPEGALRRYAAEVPLVEDASYPLPDARTAGISIYGGDLWLLEPGGEKLTVYGLNGARPEPLRSSDLRPLLKKNSAISDFAVGGGYLWLITENPSELARLDLKRLKFAKFYGK